MLPLITLIIGLVLGYFLRRPPRAQFIEPKEVPYPLNETFEDREGAQFIESVSFKEKFKNAKKITDLTNG